MISLETVADDGLDIYAAMAGVTFSNLPSAPSTHKILVKISLTNLAESATRNLRVKATTAGDTYLIYTDHYISLTNGDADDVLVCQIGPFVYGVGPDLDVTIGSDNAGDTEVDVEITVFSDDPEYYLTCRAAETTPTANSLTARIKAIDTNTGGLGGAAMRGTDGANTVVPDAAGVVATALGLLETHGDGTWATATSTTVSDKTGFKLASDGLDSVATTAPTGVASNFREMIVAVWRRFFKKATKTDTEIKTYADAPNDTDVLTTQAISDDGTTETQGGAS